MFLLTITQIMNRGALPSTCCSFWSTVGRLQEAASVCLWSTVGRLQHLSVSGLLSAVCRKATSVCLWSTVGHLQEGNSCLSLVHYRLFAGGNTCLSLVHYRPFAGRQHLSVSGLLSAVCRKATAVYLWSTVGRLQEATAVYLWSTIGRLQEATAVYLWSTVGRLQEATAVWLRIDPYPWFLPAGWRGSCLLCSDLKEQDHLCSGHFSGWCGGRHYHRWADSSGAYSARSELLEGGRRGVVIPVNVRARAARSCSN